MYIASALNRFVLDISGANAAPGAPIIVWPRDPRSSPANVTNRHQHWNVPRRSARGHISSLLNGFVLDIWQANPAPGTRIVAWPRHRPPQNQQVWTLEPGPDNRFFIVSALNGFVLDIWQANPAAGTPVVAWPRHDPPAAHQLWLVEQMID